MQRNVARISLIVSGTKRCHCQLPTRSPYHCHRLHTAATLIHTMDKDICFQNSQKKCTENNFISSELSVSRKNRSDSKAEARWVKTTAKADIDGEKEKRPVESTHFNKTRPSTSKTIQTPRNPKRLSNWALNISSRAFYTRFIFGADILNTSVHPRRCRILGRYTYHLGTGNMVKRTGFIAALPAIKSCIRCKCGFRGRFASR